VTRHNQLKRNFQKWKPFWKTPRIKAISAMIVLQEWLDKIQTPIPIGIGIVFGINMESVG
jgi:hypothetical protein